MLTCKETAALLKDWNDILVICHENPDGDALGSMFGLVRGLRAMGKQADWYCASPVPGKFAYLTQGVEHSGLTPAHVLTVDVADQKLLGDAWEKFGDKMELAIDHHGVHRPFANARWVDPESAATAEMIWLLLQALEAPADAGVLGCLYTGIVTDTGCFRYRNVTPRTLRVAASLLEAGAPAGDINKQIYESKKLAAIRAEVMELNTLEVFCGGKCSMIQIPRSIIEETGADEGDMDGSVGRAAAEIEGVLIFVSLKEKEDGSIKASLRTSPPANASVIAQRFGGGGHAGAAGCPLDGLDMAGARLRMMEACQQYLAEIGCV